ncbi:MAG: serine/threonine protein phosphatase, partial [Gammaproteobacteria bacterium]|nr:serine/threonine protein phosphatase [Gammaproteobacteria bacterium]
NLKGNHEDLVLRFLDGELSAGIDWLDYGGTAALADYGITLADGNDRSEPALTALRELLARALPPAHLAFLRALPASHGEGGYHFAHAGVRPGVPLAEQNDMDQIWIRGRFLASDADHGAVVVHGHCISPQPEVCHNRIGIDTGAFASGVLTCLILDGAERTFMQTSPQPAPYVGRP